MSRIGKLPIPVPSGVEVTISGQDVTVKGPKGTLSHTVVEPITIEQSDGQLLVGGPNDERDAKARHGLTRTLVANMVTGVTDGYSKTVEIVGTGYRAQAKCRDLAFALGSRVQAKGSDLGFALGFSHPGTARPTDGISFTVEAPTRFVVTGIDKQKV